MKEKIILLDYASNKYSQFGEDGIIAKILEIIPHNDKWCVEFGAWDGRVLSNTCRLIEESGYSAVLIEGDPIKYAELQSNFAENSKVVTIKEFINFDTCSLDKTLRQTNIPLNFDFLSIDIDGCDYHIWASLNEYKPKVVCIEYNPTMSNEVRFIQEKNFSCAQGASISSIVELANDKGYNLICVTKNNAIFVCRDLYQHFDIEDNSIQTLRKDNSWVSHIFFGYDGSVTILGANHNPWNGIALNRMIKQLPKKLRKFPGSMNLAEKKLLGLWKKVFRLSSR